MTSEHLYDEVKHLNKYFLSYFKAISNANKQSILCLIITRMMSVTRMTSHLNDESLEWRVSLTWWVSLDHSHDEWSLAWWVITRMMSDHSHDEWSLTWWSSFKWRVTRMMSFLNNECHSPDEWDSHDEWSFAWCKIMYHPVYKMTIFARVMQIHLKSMVNNPFIWKCKVKRMCVLWMGG